MASNESYRACELSIQNFSPCSINTDLARHYTGVGEAPLTPALLRLIRAKVLSRDKSTTLDNAGKPWPGSRSTNEQHEPFTRPHQLLFRYIEAAIGEPGPYCGRDAYYCRWSEATHDVGDTQSLSKHGAETSL